MTDTHPAIHHVLKLLIRGDSPKKFIKEVVKSELKTFHIQKKPPISDLVFHSNGKSKRYFIPGHSEKDQGQQIFIHPLLFTAYGDKTLYGT